MILYVKGSLFDSPAQVLVNTVNTVGVMGKGVALEFKKLYPEMFLRYRELCETKQLAIGKLWLYKSPNKWVLNFPTKEHWRYPSRVEYIVAGLKTFRRVYARWGVHSIAFPPLGCGHGRLDFATQVQPIMQDYLESVPIDVFIHPTRQDDFVAEHEQPDAMREWLRTEPTSLPFTEVWEDIVQLLQRHEAFATCTARTPFTVEVHQSGDGLLITTRGDHRHRMSYDTLMGFWQQLRDHGFSTRHIAPGISASKVAYLLPVFARLEYVIPVQVSWSYSNLERQPATGLQVLPSAFTRVSEGEQLALFKLV